MAITVGELIERLEGCPEDTEVFFRDMRYPAEEGLMDERTAVESVQFIYWRIPNTDDDELAYVRLDPMPDETG